MAGASTSKGVQTSPQAVRADLDVEVETLRQQVRTLQRVSSLGMLAGGIAHELNNALTPILSYAKLGLRNEDPDYRRRAFERIQEAAERASAITGGVLGLARPGSNRREPTDLVRLVESILLLAGKELQKHSIRYEFRAEGRPFAKVDAAQIQQVLLNLVINARQAMPDGGELRLAARLDATGRMAELSVADTGIGITPADLKRIFEPFFTTKSAPDASGLGGTGLGLPMCREIIEAHRGRLRVESRPGQGTTFTLRLPACFAPSGAKG